MRLDLGVCGGLEGEGEEGVAKYQGPPVNGASLDRFLMANLAIYTN